MAIETLRPNAAGDEENIAGVQGNGVGSHYAAVDEEVADDVASFVTNESPTYERDLYNIENHSIGSGTINKVTLYFRLMGWDGSVGIKGAIKSDSTVTETAEKDPYTEYGNNTWHTYSNEWAVNPADSEAWEWTDIDALQIGVALKRIGPTADAYCTQLYIEVDYTGVTEKTSSDTGSGTDVVESLFQEGVTTETLRPNGVGDDANLIPLGDTPNWKCVDDVIPDITTTVKTTTTWDAWSRDLYNIADSEGAGTIDYIKVYARCEADYTPDRTSLKIVIKSGTGEGAPDTVDESSEIELTTSYADYSNQWNTNPATSAAWTWDEIDKLQAGVVMRCPHSSVDNVWSFCTQVYVVVVQVAIPKTSSDTGSGVDASVIKGMLVADTGSGVDIFTGNRDLALLDSGAGVEAYGDRIFAAAETGVGAELASLLVTLIENDEFGYGIDMVIAFLQIWQVFGSDSGTGTDALVSLLNKIQREDTASGIDALMNRDIFKVEAGSGVDALVSLLYTLSRQDTGEGVEASIKTIIEHILQASDSGVGVDEAVMRCIGRLLKLRGYTRAYSNLIGYTKPYSDLRVYTYEVKK